MLPQLSDGAGRSIGDMFGYSRAPGSALSRWSGHPSSVLPPSHPGIVRYAAAVRAAALGGAEMGVASMREDTRRASGNVELDDDGASWPYGRAGDRTGAAYPRQRSPSGPGRVGERGSASAGHRTGRHAQNKGRRPVLASLAVTRIQSLSRARASRRGAGETLAGEPELRNQPDRRMAGRGAHAASWPAMPPR